MMKTIKMTNENFLEIVNDLILQGWEPAGEWLEMKFKKNEKTYDLSGADLNQLDRIEQEGLFLIN